MAGRRRRLGALCFVLLAAAAPAVTPGAAADEPIELTPPVRESLIHVQDGWLRWIGAFYQDRPEEAEAITGELLASARELGMRGLPDLARAAGVQAVRVAREGDAARARWALAAAERLDPGRPETAFARATVERLDGSWLAAAAHWLRGWTLLARLPTERRLWTHDAALFLLYGLLLAGGLFVALSLAVHGPALGRDLAALLGPRLPAWAVVPAAVVLLAWPLALPAGPVALVLWLSLLLWSYGSRSERLVIAGLWLLLAATPWIVEGQRRAVMLELSPPARAMANLGRGRLYGALFSDLAVLPAVLPEEPAVDHLLADLHRRLGQWDRAQGLYREVLAAEPANAAALIDLGGYYFYRGDSGNAARLFRQAGETAPESGLPWFNLSRTYSQAYQFEEMEQALTEARARDQRRLGQWMDATGDGRVVAANGGLQRIPELRAALARVLQPAPAEARWVERLRRGWTALLALALLLAAAAAGRLRRHLLAAAPVPPAAPGRAAAAGEPRGRWSRVLVPGLPSLAAGRGGRAFLALLVPALLVLLVGVDRLVYEIPLATAAGSAVPALAVAALVLVLAGRAAWVRVREA